MKKQVLGMLDEMRLCNKIPSYREYAKKVPYVLIPYVW